MYKMEIALTEKEILEFEKLRNQVFKGKKPLEKKTQSPFAQAIEKGELLAFQCLNEKEELVGGMLIGLKRNNIELLRMFVRESSREQGVGTFMVKYLDANRKLFEDYYGVEQIEGCVLTPVLQGVDYWASKGFDFAGPQMYKRFKERRN